jgi:hypothetical protein
LERLGGRGVLLFGKLQKAFRCLHNFLQAFCNFPKSRFLLENCALFFAQLFASNFPIKNCWAGGVVGGAKTRKLEWTGRASLRWGALGKRGQGTNLHLKLDLSTLAPCAVGLRARAGGGFGGSPPAGGAHYYSAPLPALRFPSPVSAPCGYAPPHALHLYFQLHHKFAGGGAYTQMRGETAGGQGRSR